MQVLEDIQTAVHKAQCDDIIEKFDQGLKLRLVEKGFIYQVGKPKD